MKNSDYFEKLTRIESPDATWHPDASPLVLDHAQDSYVWDVEAQSYIDMIAGFGSLPLGHNNELLDKKLNAKEKSLVQGMGDVYASRFKIAYMEKLLSFLPSYLNKVALAVTGSQAVELAMKTAMKASGGSAFIAFKDAYHGLDLGCLAITGNPYFRDPFNAWLNNDHVEHLPFACEVDIVRASFEKFRNRGIKVAGIIVEPIQGRGGFKSAPLEWLRSLKALCEEYNCYLIYDEVFTGFGRSGRITFAEEAPADLVCFGKAIGGGMPISACVGSHAVMTKAWSVNKGEAIHTGTFFGHAYSCRVGLATLELLEELNLVQISKDLGAKFLEDLKKSLASSPLIKDVRGQGLMIAVEFNKFEHSLEAMVLLKSEGILLIPCGTKGECVSLTPALNIEQSLLDKVLVKLLEVTAYLERKS